MWVAYTMVAPRCSHSCGAGPVLDGALLVLSTGGSMRRAPGFQGLLWFHPGREVSQSTHCSQSLNLEAYN
jgi:hypothetical protein